MGKPSVPTLTAQRTATIHDFDSIEPSPSMFFQDNLFALLFTVRYIRNLRELPANRMSAAGQRREASLEPLLSESQKRQKHPSDGEPSEVLVPEAISPVAPDINIQTAPDGAPGLNTPRQLRETQLKKTQVRKTQLKTVQLKRECLVRMFRARRRTATKTSPRKMPKMGRARSEWRH
ncbi:hypothetical protein VSDG_03078 [Cytospora chrysosperma]|uniref:Uncharacterized protein n=1 Tax=Cytospora chrysosperma TaxID=252740 RepID=A0A423W8F3_CYTCH|nr:hypothetical protein VSDG_03078 [Valsa sordida]